MATPWFYVGITGFTKNKEIEFVKEFSEICFHSGVRFMSGILVSYKTLKGIEITNNRYPATKEMCVDVFKKLKNSHHNTWPVVHYNTHSRGEELRRELNEIKETFPGISGIQLNIINPDPNDVEKFIDKHKDIEIIVQANKTSIEMQDGLTKKEKTKNFIKKYDCLASHVLIDMSGGRGVDIDVKFAENVINLWEEEDFGLSPAFAGGLDAEKVKKLNWICSYDSESKMRSRDGLELDYEKSKSYVRSAASMLKPVFGNNIQV